MTERKEHSSVEALKHLKAVTEAFGPDEGVEFDQKAWSALHAAIKAMLSAHKALMSVPDVAQPSEASEQRSVSDVEPVAWQYRDFRADGFWTAWIGCDKPLPKFNGREVRALYTTPYVATPLPQRKPQFKEFIKWAGAQGYDCAQTCNSDTGEWIVLNPVTADL